MNTPDDQILSVFFTAKRAAAIYDDLLHSSDPSARMVGRMIEDSLPADYFEKSGVRLSINIEAAAAPDPKDLLDSAIRNATIHGKTIPPNSFINHFQNAQNWGLALLQQFFLELRQAVCGKGKKAAALGPPAQGALAALGTAVCKHLGVSGPLGIGIAVLVVTNVAWIGKVAFCKMTSPAELVKYFA